MKLFTTILLFLALIFSAAAQKCDLHFEGWGTYGGLIGGEINLDTLGQVFTVCDLPSSKRWIIWDDPTKVFWFNCMQGYYAYIGSHNQEKGHYEIGYAWKGKNHRYRVTETPNRARLRYVADGSCDPKDGFA